MGAAASAATATEDGGVLFGLTQAALNVLCGVLSLLVLLLGWKADVRRRERMAAQQRYGVAAAVDSDASTSLSAAAGHGGYHSTGAAPSEVAMMPIEDGTLEGGGGAAAVEPAAGEAVGASSYFWKEMVAKDADGGGGRRGAAGGGGSEVLDIDDGDLVSGGMSGSAASMVLGANEEVEARLQRELLVEAQVAVAAEKAAAAGDRYAYSLDI